MTAAEERAGRERDAEALAAAIGWRWHPDMRSGASFSTEPPVRGGCRMVDEAEWIALPSPDAPLREHLGFVGRVAEALRPQFILAFSEEYERDDRTYGVGFWRPAAFPADNFSARKTDASWACMLAALRALEARR